VTETERRAGGYRETERVNGDRRKMDGHDQYMYVYAVYAYMKIYINSIKLYNY
jgi:hypothetical protein